MTYANLHRQSNWLYGVIVGLGIRESLVSGTAQMKLYAAGPQSWGTSLEGWRIALFLVLIIRFYFRSVVFFEETYGIRQAGRSRPQRSYGLDFLIGFVHFILFFLWATTIDLHTTGRLGLNTFEGLLFLILLYDWLWLIVSVPFKGNKRINFWTALNAVTVLICIAVIYISSSAGADAVLTEHLVIFPVMIISVLDLWDLMTGKKLFVRLLARLTPL